MKDLDTQDIAEIKRLPKARWFTLNGTHRACEVKRLRKKGIVEARKANKISSNLAYRVAKPYWSIYLPDTEVPEIGQVTTFGRYKGIDYFMGEPAHTFETITCGVPTTGGWKDISGWEPADAEEFDKRIESCNKGMMEFYQRHGTKGEF